MDWAEIVTVAAASASGLSIALTAFWYTYSPRLIDVIQKTVDPLTMEVHDLAREQAKHQAEMATFAARNEVLIADLNRRITRNENRIEGDRR